MATAQPTSVWFGLGIDPGVQNLSLALQLAQLADDTGLDFLSMQDHPYNPEFLDTWTLLTILAARTRRIHLLPDVLTLPLRPPAMLAKAAATLDIISGGRLELGLGTGALWDGIVAYGGPHRNPTDAILALEEAIQILRALWQEAPAEPVSFPGRFYQLLDAHPGPPPSHPLRIWIGAQQPRLLRLTGRLADGWLVSSPRVPPDDLAPLQAEINEGARRADRPPTAIRRGYNLAGVILSTNRSAAIPTRKGLIIGPVEHWIAELTRFIRDLHMDTLNFSSIGEDIEAQARLFAEQVVPTVRNHLK